MPEFYPREEYEKTRAEVVAKMKTYPDVVAVMDFGTEPYPGISDIDFYVVFRNDAEHIFIPRTRPYSPVSQYLMMHTVLLSSEEFIKELRYLNPWSIFAEERFIYTAQGFVRPTIIEPTESQTINNASFMVDKLDSIFAHLPQFVNKELPARLIFEICKNAVYCIWRLEDLDIKATPAQLDFIERFDATRKEWFELDQQEGMRRLIGFFEEVMQIAFEIAWMLDSWLSSQLVSTSINQLGIKQSRKTKWDRSSKNIYCHTLRYARLYTDARLTWKEAFEKTMRASELVTVNIPGRRKQQMLNPVILPWNLSAFLMTTASQQGILSDAVKRDIWTNASEVPVLHDENFDHKIKVQNELTLTYSQKRIPGGEGKGYIYGNQTFGYLFGEERFLRKFLVWYLRRKFFGNLNNTYGS